MEKGANPLRTRHCDREQSQYATERLGRRESCELKSGDLPCLISTATSNWTEMYFVCIFHLPFLREIIFIIKQKLSSRLYTEWRKI